jgi:hypothetical protein
MNTIQKATFAASALAITLVGAALVTAPIAFARPLPVMAHSDCATASLQLTQSSKLSCTSFTREAGLVAVNRG